MRCPCGSGDEYAACCRRCHLDEIAAPTAEALMRSRFSAFAMRQPDHLIRTWHRSTRPKAVDLDLAVRWTRLDIIATVDGTPFDTTGVVEFRAYYLVGGRRGERRERSTFVREKGQWYYVDGVLLPT
jgi:SEC-C motif-containing protein